MTLPLTPHRRWNPLTGEWVLVSPHRTQRPWSGQVEEMPVDTRPAYDPACYLCAGNTRANGEQNPAYQDTYVFANDFAALLPEVPAEVYQHGMLRAETESGICRVICFSPRHDLTLAQMTPAQIRPVITCWIEQTRELGARPDIAYVQIFENKGAMMGCSNPHPHGQIWATAHVPNEPAKELRRQHTHFADTGQCLLCDYLATEQESRERTVLENDLWIVMVPFWACWPFETLVLPKRHHSSLPELTGEEQDALAAVMHQLTAGYDRLFGVSFPYSMGWHQAPTDGQHYEAWHLHGHFYPPLLRSATVKKFMVGFELLGTSQRDITPEAAATRLREVMASGAP